VRGPSRHRRLHRVPTAVTVVLTVSAILVSIGGTASAAKAPPGVTDTEIKVGIEIAAQTDALTNAFGTNSLTDPTAPYKVAVDDLNKRGGILGRKVVPVFAPFKVASGTAAENDQAVCAKFTQDEPVLVAMIILQHTDALLSCLEKAGVLVMIAPGFTHDDATTFKQFPHYVGVGVPNLSRQAKAYIDSMVKQEFFTKGAKIGLLRVTTPAYDRVAKKVIVPELKKHGLHVTEEVTFPRALNLAESSASVAAVSSAVLKFKSAGVDHVIELSSGFVSLFMVTAQSQEYKPHYGLSIGVSSLSDQVMPPPQKVGTIGIGWSPPIDVTKPELNTEGQACVDLMLAAGRPTPTQNTTLSNYLTACDEFALLAKAATASGKQTPTADSLLAGLYKLGDVELGSSFTNHFSAKQRDGVAAVADLAYEEGCRCWVYTSTPKKI
jgi:ABC-type branched-subunit amino acid transport system substrate-binding protein